MPALREGDVAFRTGGDEFLVLLPETTSAAAEAVVDADAGGRGPPFSYGLAEAPLEVTTVAELLRVADQRLLEGRRELADRISRSGR